jgi:hypothetical protein
MTRKLQYNKSMKGWLQEWATKHTSPGTDTGRWVGEQAATWFTSSPGPVT